MEQLTLFEMATPSMPTLDVTRCYTRLVNHATAANMVEQYHYAHRVPQIMLSVGMYVDDVLAGVCVYGNCTTDNMRNVCGDEQKKNVWELNRLFVHEWAGKNSESWLVAQSFKMIERYAPFVKILISYADTGENHIGYIYQATNWIYTGMSNPTPSDVKINGRTWHVKTLFDELGTHDRDIIRAKYPDAVWIEPTRKHRYVMFLGNKREKRALRATLKWSVLPYPKA